MLRSAYASAGIDVAEPRKGLDYVALDHARNVVVSRGRLTVEDVVQVTMSLRPEVVCVDSPSGWSTCGRSRLAERELASVGIQSYRTGADPGDHPFYAWMRVGFEIFRRLSAVYRLFRGRWASASASAHGAAMSSAWRAGLKVRASTGGRRRLNNCRTPT
jgi:hypothetical protein